MGKARANQSAQIKQKKKVAESELKWQFVVFFVRSTAPDLKITFIPPMFTLTTLRIPDPASSLP